MKRAKHGIYALGRPCQILLVAYADTKLGLEYPQEGGSFPDSCGPWRTETPWVPTGEVISTY